MMRKLVVLTVLAASVAAMVAASPGAKPPGTNGLISFTRFDPALDQDVVYTINPDGSGERPLLVGGESGHWSPDGSRILVVPDCCAERILNPDNGSYTELPTYYPDLGLFLGCNVWSPDGRRLACEGVGDQPSANGVYTIRSSDGGDVRRVTSGADDDYPGDYSPNGKRIVFLRSSFDSGLAALYTVKLDGSDLRQITPSSGLLDFTGGSWSPQGNEILFSAKPSEGQRSAAFVVHADGSGLQQIPIPGCGTTYGCHEPV
jgi:Tol biopolymer transport system component